MKNDLDALWNADPVPGKPTDDHRTDAPLTGFGLYIHWPFCKAKCPYCDFNSHVRAQIDHDRWCRALLEELTHGASRWIERKLLTSIFFGGGTPSLMRPSTVGAIIDRASHLFEFADDIEITLEANPTSVEAANFAGFAKAGVNRVSLGIQSFDDGALQFLGREHNSAEAIRAIEIAKSHFRRSSFDLIYARAGQTEDSWQKELDRALDLADSHISLYQLTIEPGTRFHAEFQAGQLPVMADDDQAKLFELTVDRLQACQFAWYEISNFAREGQQSHHNLVYWRYDDYLGVGPGAHSRLQANGNRRAISTLRAPDRWLRAVENLGHGIEEDASITQRQAVIEALMMGLRLQEGLPLSRLVAIGGPNWRDAINFASLQTSVQEGWLIVNDGTLKATAGGRLLLDGILADLVEP